MIYLQREKDEDALLDFITTSFVFSETETENNLKKKEPDIDEGSLDAEEVEEEEEDGEEFVAKVSVNFRFCKLVVGFGGGEICMEWTQDIQHEIIGFEEGKNTIEKNGGKE